MKTKDDITKDAIERGRQRLYNDELETKDNEKIYRQIAIVKNGNKYYVGVHELSSDNISMEEFDREEYWSFNSLAEAGAHISKEFCLKITDFKPAKGQKFVFDFTQIGQ
jgi:hypothetical protein